MVWVCHLLKYITHLRLGSCDIAYLTILFGGGGEEASDGCKMNENHVTVFVSADAFGTHKLKCLIVGYYRVAQKVQSF
jgi:hypothetical protein